MVEITHWIPVSAPSPEEAERLAASTHDLGAHDCMPEVNVHDFAESPMVEEVVPLGESQNRTIRQILEADRRAGGGGGGRGGRLED